MLEGAGEQLPREVHRNEAGTGINVLVVSHGSSTGRGERHRFRRGNPATAREFHVHIAGANRVLQQLR